MVEDGFQMPGRSIAVSPDRGDQAREGFQGIQAGGITVITQKQKMANLQGCRGTPQPRNGFLVAMGVTEDQQGFVG